MSGDVEVQDATTPVLDNEEAVQELERYRRNGQKVHGDDGFAMIVEKRQPALAWIAGLS